jgi:hypothetical protein
MPRLFDKILTFHVQGEIYDSYTNAEDIIENYSFVFKDYNDGIDHSYIVIDHKDHRGRITKIRILPQIHKQQKPDTELLVV